MKGFLPILCVLVFTIAIFGINQQPAYGDMITAKSTSLDYSSILELRNNRGSDANIDSVRIWLTQDNSFKSFKTENGWTGKFEIGGQVLVFSPQDSVKPGENVKFGLKTNEKNPLINWKALDGDGNVLQTAAVITKQSDKDQTPQINQPKIIAIKDDSTFRFIPEKPTIGSTFRIVGENFIPNQNVEFYIGEMMIKSIKINADGKFVSTGTVPDDITEDRIDFVVSDSGGTEKTMSLRLTDVENREMSDDVKISIEFTAKEVKRGDTVKIQGGASPDTTLTITSKNNLGKVLDINTVTSGFDGKWEFNHPFPIDLKLGKIIVEITDGKTTAVRNFDVISSQLINIEPVQKRYEVGDYVKFVGSAIPDNQLTVILEDPVGVEIFSKTIIIDSTGNVAFDVEIDDAYPEGTYVLHAFQGSETTVSVVGVGVQPQRVLIVSTSELNYAAGSLIDLSIQGEPLSSVSLVVIDESDETKVNDTVILDDNGNFIYEINGDDIGTGAFTVEARHGTGSRGDTVFTVGLSTGAGLIEFQTTKDVYALGDQILVIGKTSNSVILTVKISDPNGHLFREFEIFSDRIGTFKIDTFRIPSNGLEGNWSMEIGSGTNFVEKIFSVVTDTNTIQIKLDKEDGVYNDGEMMAVSVVNAKIGDYVDLTITAGGGLEIIDTLRIGPVTGSGEFYTLWEIPKNTEAGTYEMSVTDSKTTNSISFTVE